MGLQGERVAHRHAVLAVQGRLLIAGDAGDRDAGRQRPGGGAAEVAGRWQHAGQDGGGDGEGGEQILVPGQTVDIEAHGARGVGGVGGVDGALGQAEEEVGVDGAEADLAGLGPGPQAGHVFEQPDDLGRGEVGVDDQTGPLGDQLSEPRLAVAAADVRGAAALPDNGIVHGRAALPVPEHRGFALVRDPDRHDLARVPARVGQGAGDDLAGDVPDLGRVMGDPSRLREALPELLLGRTQAASVRVDQDGSDAGRAEVECEDHAGFLLAECRATAAAYTIPASGRRRAPLRSALSTGGSISSGSAEGATRRRLRARRCGRGCSGSW